MDGFKQLSVKIEPDLYEILDSYSRESVIAKRYIVETALALFFSREFEYTDDAICKWLDSSGFADFVKRINYELVGF